MANQMTDEGSDCASVPVGARQVVREDVRYSVGGQADCLDHCSLR